MEVDINKTLNSVDLVMKFYANLLWPRECCLFDQVGFFDEGQYQKGGATGEWNYAKINGTGRYTAVNDG